MLENTELLGQILDVCHQKKSGTLFLTSSENKICHIVFEEGRIVAMDYGQLRGEAVAERLVKLKILRQDFNSAMTAPLSSRARIDPAVDVFAKLGFRRIGEAIETPAVTPATQRMYRGHAIAVAEPEKPSRSVPVNKPIEPAQPAMGKKPKKSKRIYRGQVIED